MKKSLTLLLSSAMLAGASTAVLAQASGAVGTGPATTAPGGAMQSPTINPGARTTTTGSAGVNTGGVNQPGVPNTSSPGTIGTGASPSGLPGDSATSPGYPSGTGGVR